MKILSTVLLMFVCVASQAQNFMAATGPLPDSPQQRQFWTFDNKLSFGALAAFVAADGITTQRGLNEGLREANPIMRPFVTNGAAGEAAGSALGFGAALGTAYLLHRTHHYKAERIAVHLMVGTEGAVVGHNIMELR